MGACPTRAFYSRLSRCGIGLAAHLVGLVRDPDTDPDLGSGYLVQERRRGAPLFGMARRRCLADRASVPDRRGNDSRNHRGAFSVSVLVVSPCVVSGPVVVRDRITG